MPRLEILLGQERRHPVMNGASELIRRADDQGAGFKWLLGITPFLSAVDRLGARQRLNGEY